MAEHSHGVKYTPWKVGDKVWLLAKNLIIPIPKKKLGPKRYGPFLIKAILSPITFTLLTYTVRTSRNHHPISSQKKKNTKSKPSLCIKGWVNEDTISYHGLDTHQLVTNGSQKRILAMPQR
jgi:hypothetical protein